VSSKYYESELAYLREMGREFALVHPSTAGLLSEKGSDPDVERLLEGFAFLTARIRERIDDAAPDIVHGLLQLLLPHYLRPVPASAIIQYDPPLKALRGVHEVARGTRVAGKPVQGTACEFRTTQQVDLLPLELEEVVLDETKAAHPAIRLRFETTDAGQPLITRREGLRFFLHGETSLTTTLYAWLFRYLEGIEVHRGAGDPVSLGPDHVRPVGFGPEEALLPWPALGHEGYRYVQEYFTLPSKFLFFDIHDLSGIELESDKFEITLRFERPPELQARLSKDNFRLFCTPVINLFEVSADPVKRDPKLYEYLLRAAGIKPSDMEVYSVESVVGIRQGQARRRQYPPFYGFTHVFDPESSYYTLRPSTSPIDDGIDMYLAIATARNVPPVTEEEVLSIDLVCTNRSLAAELRIGEICATPRGVSTAAPFKNITPVTVPVRPKLGAELQWRLLSHMALNRTSLGSPEVLKAVLSLYNFQKETSPAAGRANELKIESIRDVTSEPVTRLMGGAPVRGVETRIELEEGKLGTPGEAFVFGCMLDELFATHVPLNSFNELHCVLHPSKLEFRWPARNGQKKVL
jgi:type VI secretion system protein ImpG